MLRAIPSSTVHWGKFLNLSESQFLQLQSGDKPSRCPNMALFSLARVGLVVSEKFARVAPSGRNENCNPVSFINSKTKILNISKLNIAPRVWNLKAFYFICLTVDAGCCWDLSRSPYMCPLHWLLGPLTAWQLCSISEHFKTESQEDETESHWLL